MAGSSSNTVPREVTESLRQAMDAAGITEQTDLVARILATGVGLGMDDTDRLDLKITSAALTEMRAAFGLFAPYRDVPKVTIFGSARTKANDPLYRQAKDAAHALSDHGWFVVTGAGPGIMQAAADGAGPDRSIGVSIRLPFEEKPNALLADSENLVSMKYFFTRKLMLMKESHGFICVPGGFGTMDEMFELLTLQQTGKAEPMPIVLLDEPGGTFWAGLRRFIDQHLVPAGVIDPDDFDRVLVTDSVPAAVDEVTGFWRNYDSLRWVRSRLVLRMRIAPDDAQLAELNERFAHLLTEGAIARTDPLRDEQEDGDRLELPRLVMTFNPFKVGELHRVIRAMNEWARPS
nr:TIGR00730 family Rossman fold protein [Microbacterium bovistercoris]